MPRISAALACLALLSCLGKEPPVCPPGEGLGTWQELSRVGIPAHRYHHAMVDIGGRVLIWGGLGDDGPLGDGAIYNVAEDTWTPLSSLGAPSPRSEFAWAWTGQFLVVFGGRAGDVILGDGAYLDVSGDAWRPLPTENAPASRYRASAVAVGQVVYVVGGVGQDGPVDDGSWVDVSTGTAVTWNRMNGHLPLRVSTDPRPHVGQPLPLFALPTRLVAFSGLGDGGPSVRVATLKLPPTGNWELDDARLAPPARLGAAIAWNNSQVFIHGGHLPDREPGEDPGDYLDDMGVYTLPDVPGLALPNAWTSAPGVGDVSLPRAFSTGTWALWADPPLRAMLVVGGVDPGHCIGGVFWNWSSMEWSRLAASGAPRVGRMPGVVWSAGKLVVFGGHRPPSQAELGPVGGVWWY